MIKIRNPKQQRNQGFTLLELLIVVGIIAILISILALGGRSVMKTVKTSATKVTLDNLVSLQAEYEAASGNISNALSIPLIRADHLGNPLGDIHYGSQDLYTQRVIRLIMKNPKVKSAMAKMPSSSVADVVPNWEHDPDSPPDGSSSIKSIWSRSLALGPIHLSINYKIGDVVKQTDNGGVTRYYRCIANTPNDVANQPSGSTANTGYWRYLGTTNPSPFPVPIDAWGNAVKFVGPSGLIYLYSSPKKERLWYGPIETPPFKDDNIYPEYDQYPSAGLHAPVAAEYRAHRIQPSFASDNERPFWVSAGPDGDFATHDDNVYSFEN